MTDDVTRYGSGASAGEPLGGTPGGDDEAALERLRALTPGGGEPAHATPIPGARAERQPRLSRAARGAKQRLAAPIRRPAAAAGGGGRTAARLAVPVVFLIAVVVLIVLVLQSGVLGGADTTTPVVSASPSASPSKTGTTTKTATKTYVVRSGDTLSGIAEKFGLSVADLEELNPKLSSTTLVVGTKIRVPRE